MSIKCNFLVFFKNFKQEFIVEIRSLGKKSTERGHVFDGEEKMKGSDYLI